MGTARVARWVVAVAVALTPVGCGTPSDVAGVAAGAALDASGSLAGVDMVASFDRQRVAAGDAVHLSVAVTNRAETSRWWSSGGCRTLAVAATADVTGLLAAGRRWPGVAGQVKEGALGLAVPADFTSAEPSECDDIHLTNELRPGATATTELVWRAPSDDVPVAAGALPAAVTFRFSEREDGAGRRALAVRADLTFEGTASAAAPPAAVLDSMLADATFGDWLAGLHEVDDGSLAFDLGDGAWSLVVFGDLDAIGRIWADPEDGRVLQVHFGAEPPPDLHPGDG